MDYVVVVCFVLLSGCFSGLTLGMFSLNLTSLERKMKLGDIRAIRIHGVRRRGNLLLCTLLLGNTATNAAMAIFLNSIAGGIIAGFISTGLILVFGEILPQAVFARFALNVGSRLVWLVKIFIVLFYPVAMPLAVLLDKLLGEELPTIWDKSELQEIIRHHEDSPDSSIDADEERIILGALSFSDRTANDVMTPRTVVYALEGGRIVDRDLVEEIRQSGFTRIPVYENSAENVVGVLKAKRLLGINYDENKTVIDLAIRDGMIAITGNMKLDALLNLFLKKKKHMAIVFDEFGDMRGIVTLEDVIEEILKIEIVDEEDYAEDMQALAKLKLQAKNVLGSGSVSSGE